jgi:FO synthase subunit 2
MRPKEIRKLIRAAGRIPAQRSTAYRLIKKFDSEGDEDDSALDVVESSQFGSYQELIKLDKFRYSERRKQNS